MPVLDGVVNRDYWDPEVLTTIARREQALFDLQNPDSFAELFPSEEVSDIRAAIEYGPEIDDIVVANFRTFSGTATSERFGETQKAYFQLALISRNYVFDEKTLYEIRNSKKDIASPAIESYVKRAAKAIAMSAAVQRANILYNDKVELQMPNAPTQVINLRLPLRSSSLIRPLTRWIRSTTGKNSTARRTASIQRSCMRRRRLCALSLTILR